MCQTAAAQRRPHCLSKIKQCLVSRLSSSSLPGLKSTHTHMHAHTDITNMPPPPAHTLIVPCPESLIKNKLRLLVSKQHSTEVGVWSLQRQCSEERERASANLINISVSLRLRLEQQAVCGKIWSKHAEHRHAIIDTIVFSAYTVVIRHL